MMKSDRELNVKSAKQNPYQNANFFVRSTFMYMLPIFYKSYRNGFTEENLYDPLQQHRSAILCGKTHKIWEKQHSKSPKYALHRTLIKMFWLKTLISCLIKLSIETVLVTIVPYTIGNLVRYFEKDQSEISMRKACIFATIFGTTYLVTNVTFHPAMMMAMNNAMKLRICCSSLVYRKILRLSKSALGKTSIGQIVNLLSNDVTKFEQGFEITDYIFIAPIQTIIGFYVIYNEIGVAAVFGMIFLLSFVPLQGYVGKRTSFLRNKTALRTDERVKLTNEIICGMQVIKMYCWEKPFAKILNEARRKEMSSIRSHCYLMGILYSFEMFLTKTSVFISLLSFVLLGNYISAEKVFMVATIYSTLRPTITTLFSYGLSVIAEINISLRRINNFLCLEEVEAIEIGKCTQNGVCETLEISQIQSKNPRISLENVDAKWVRESSELNLKNISLEIDSNELYAIIGPVGSGKSNLLNVILGELQIVAGNLDISGKISYASQEPWLFSGTVRENILFGEVYDKKRYSDVVRSCSLKSDLLQLPFGDKTQVGERGNSLSGGQKARINLARCVYKIADIYLMDDPLSAVDANVGQNLYNDCIQTFLSGKIRILVTHQVQYLKNAASITIMENGRVERVGTYEQLANSNVNFVEFLKEDKGEKNEDEGDAEMIKVHRKISKQFSLLQSDENVNDQVSSETLVEGKIKFGTYLKYIKFGGNFLVIFSVVVVLLVARSFEYGSDFFVRTWVNMEQNSKNASFEIDREKIIYTYSGITFGIILFSMTYCLSFVVFFTKASINLHNIVVGKLMRGNMNFFDKNTSGRILNRFSKDMGIVDEYILFILYDVIAVFFALTGTVIISVFIEPYLLILCGILVILLYTCRKFYISFSRNIKRIEGITRSPIYNHTNTSIYGLTTIRASNAQNLMKKEFESILDRHSVSWFLFIASNRCFGYYLDIICVSFVTISTYVLILYSENIYGGDVGMIFNQFVTLMISLQWGMRQWSELENQMTSVERILEYTQIPTEKVVTSDSNVPKNWPERGKIEFSGVSLRYDSDFVLKNLNFVINPGEKIGIVGRTGAGKSSIISALFQLYNLEGRILIDGFDITKMNLEDVRTNISIIPQEPVLFSGSMRKNLDPFEEYDDQILWNALDQVELKETVINLGSGLSSKVSEGGANFSVGQRQLVCLARALIRNNKILVLDEATANVDPYTDSLIQKTIRSKFANCTVLTVAHRLNTVMDSDRILVMKSGRVEEFDHPHILLKKKNGLFYDLVEAAGNLTANNLKNVAENAYSKLKNTNTE